LKYLRAEAGRLRTEARWTSRGASGARLMFIVEDNKPRSSSSSSCQDAKRQHPVLDPVSRKIEKAHTATRRFAAATTYIVDTLVRNA
jgi:hypothetical protein